VELTFLGKFQVRRKGGPVLDFTTDKTRALLVYLAVEGVEHSRSALARLLWPGYSEESARNNLRQALFELRQTLGNGETHPPLLLSSRLTIQFNPAAAASVDVQNFRNWIAACAIHAHDRLETCPDCLHRLRQAADLYRGDFLTGCTIAADSPEFEEWRRMTQEQLHIQALDLLADLANAAEMAEDDEQALDYARRQLALEPWLEAAHRQIMRIFARRGQRSAATAQYNLCRQVMAAELGAEPDALTTALYEEIRSGRFPKGATRWQGEQSPEPTKASVIESPPPPLPLPALPSLPASLPFVAREHELERLQGFLAQSLAGHGQVVFVSGEAGSGKTSLVRAFAKQAQAAHPDLIVAGGICNAYTGVGDPYLPFRGLVNLLTGGLEAGGREGLFTEEQARRLWAFMPTVVPTLVEVAMDLVDSFVPRAALLTRVESFANRHADWVRKLSSQAERAEGANFDQHRLVSHLTEFLQRLAQQRPLLLILDDLHWADPSSLNLLFHLGRSLGSSRLLIIGAYRPEDVIAHADDKPHPLLPVINEFKRTFGDIGVDLDQTTDVDGRRFVDALLDSQPNHLSESFRQALFAHTEGQALFTSELLRTLQSQGSLQQDAAGYWVEPQTVDWASLPARVEGVIEQRIGRLSPALRQILQVASVEGEEFTAEVVARVQMMGERDLVRQLGEELDRRHRLVSVQGLTWVGSQRLSRYAFRHHLFQQYLYQSLSEAERAYLHADMVAALEMLYAEQIEQVVVQLARHCQAAGLTEKAMDYYRLAGEQAQRLSAYSEAIGHFRQGLALLSRLPDTPARAQRELALQLPLCNVLIAVKAYGAPEVGEALQRALSLGRQLKEPTEPLWVLHGLYRYSLACGQWQTARDWASQLVQATQERAEPGWHCEAHRSVGLILFYLGEFTSALSHFEQGILADQRQPHYPYLRQFGLHSGVVCYVYAAMSLWMLGYAEQAHQRFAQALALTDELSHPFVLISTRALAASFYYLQGNVQAVRAHSEAGLDQATLQRFEYWDGTLLMAHGWALAMAGTGATGVAEIRQGLATWLATGAELARHAYLAMLADAERNAGQPATGLAVLKDALAAVPSSGCFWAAELYRLQAELLLAQDPHDQAAAEYAFAQAVALAQQQEAKSLELRATTSLCRLWQRQGKHAEAKQRLADLYHWFKEGFETPDLQAAAALLAELTDPAYAPAAANAAASVG
jgi:DNA-binding SARP family transcriptional activator/tetratricopeptide (TPR) repeat protein